MKVELFSDIACPWCYIGERRLRRAMEARPGAVAEVRWRPYQLQPAMPPEGVPWGDFVERRFGGWERARPMFAHVASAGAGEGIRYDFERVASAPNTRDAHRLVLLAEREGRGYETAEALFAAYFAEGRDVGDREVLAAIAGEVGLDADAARAMLAGDDFAAAVDESQREAAELGVTGVPFFVFDGRFAISGAQPFDVFLQAIDRASRPE
ncbi:MAG TPA: DsbA family oxidoreductase [Longimicrobium sp.]|nr:DsbA family oxidoreductase [Longimicrobium sp.]